MTEQDKPQEEPQPSELSVENSEGALSPQDRDEPDPERNGPTGEAAQELDESEADTAHADEEPQPVQVAEEEASTADHEPVAEGPASSSEQPVVAVGVVAEEAKSNIEVLLNEVQGRNRKIMELKDALRTALEMAEEGGGGEEAQQELENLVAEHEELHQAHQQLRTEHEELESSFEALGEQKEQINNRMLRVAADLENFRRRSERERKELKRYGINDAVAELLPAVDNLERALQHADTQSNSDSFVDGVRMVYRQIVAALKKHGVTGFESVGEPFNPERHEAIQQVESSSVDTGTIVEQFQKGYFLHDRLLRPALVSVAKRVEAAEQDDEAIEQEDSLDGAVEEPSEAEVDGGQPEDPEETAADVEGEGDATEVSEAPEESAEGDDETTGASGEK